MMKAINIVRWNFNTFFKPIKCLSINKCLKTTSEKDCWATMQGSQIVPPPLDLGFFTL